MPSSVVCLSLLLTSANTLEPDQARQRIQPVCHSDGTNVVMKEFFEKIDFDRNQQTTQKHAKGKGLILDRYTINLKELLTKSENKI